jgi:hypothetical protein
MRQRLVFGAPLACFALLTLGALGAVGSLGACGGSSSETPPPLQPDPKGFHYASVPVNPASASADSDAGALPISNELDEEEKPRAPARSTWGSPKPGH